MAKVGFAAEGNADQRSDNYGIRTEIDISFKLDFMLESESRYSQWNRIAVGIKGAGVFLSLIRRVTKSPVTSFIATRDSPSAPNLKKLKVELNLIQPKGKLRFVLIHFMMQETTRQTHTLFLKRN